MGLSDRQLSKLNEVVAVAAAGNAFYQPKIAAAGGSDGFEGLEAYSRLMPFTTKQELARDQSKTTSM